MKHATTRELYAYWQRIRGGAAIPERNAVRPREIGGVLASTFILDVAERLKCPVRLAGSRVCSLYGREIGGSDFLDLWPRDDRGTVAELIGTASDRCAAVVATVDGQTVSGEAVSCELLLLPLRYAGPGCDRMLGSLVTIDPLDGPGDDRIVRQKISGLRLIWPDQPASIQPLPANPPATAAQTEAAWPPAVTALAQSGRRHGHLFVLDGGKG